MTPTALPLATIPERFAARAAACSEQPALGVIVAGRLQWHTWGELASLVGAWQGALAERGVRPGDRVAQVSPNCLEWILGDLAVLGLGAVHVPLHASLAAGQAAELIAHSEARLVVVQTADFAQRLAPMSDVPIVLHEEFPQEGFPREGSSEASGGREPSGSGGLGPGTGSPGEAEGLRPPLAIDFGVGGEGQLDDLATILYTSGTTGAPLGVMLTHRNLASNAVAITEAAAARGEETRLAILPLSHIYARTCDLYSWLIHGGRLVLAEARETLFRDCGIAAPTSINAVPYFYQKVVDALRDAGGEIDATALRSKLGGEVRRLYCGGASLPPEVDAFFAQRGLPIHCGYGLTEAAPVITATTPGDYRSGTVGPPLAGLDVRLADDGEVQVRGPNVMRGYWRDDEATARVLRDGWLLTGDLGEWDSAGHLRIVGRKKEMIVLATGKKVAPTRVEELLAGSPWIEQACVVGDERKCLTALVVPNGNALRREIKRRGLWVWSRRRALSHPQVQALYREEIDRCLSGLAEFEQVAAFTLLGRAFSLELGEVTPKLSLCRKVIGQRFAAEIDAMYC
jgi:long-chain acyl-CoA synthetase